MTAYEHGKEHGKIMAERRDFTAALSVQRNDYGYDSQYRKGWIHGWNANIPAVKDCWKL